MSRMTSDAVVVKPTNNVYTVLVIVAFVLEVIGFVVLVLGASRLFPQGGIF